LAIHGFIFAVLEQIRRWFSRTYQEKLSFLFWCIDSNWSVPRTLQLDESTKRGEGIIFWQACFRVQPSVFRI